MKKIIAILLISLLSLGMSSCNNNCNNNKTYIISLDYRDGREIVEFETSGTFDIENPIREGYKFLGWLTEDKQKFEGNSVNSDMLLTADWLKLNEEFSLFYDPCSGVMPAEFIDKYLTGQTTTLPIPTRKYHKFEGWYLDQDFVIGPYYEVSDTTTGTKTFYAKWVDIAEYKTISYELKGGSISDQAIFKYIPGEVYEILPAIKEGYFFGGWYDNHQYKGNPIRVIDESYSEDIVLYAKWKEKTLQNANISIYGDSISTFEGYLPEGYATYYPISAVSNVEDTWWHKAILGVNANLHVNASYSGTGVVTAGAVEAFSGQHLERIEQLRKDNIDPDIIIIFLGVNDCKRNQSVKLFKSGYLTMLERIYAEYRSTQVIVCTLNACTFSDRTCYDLRLKYNEAIREVAKEYNLPVIELDKIITEENKSSYMANMLHPNRAGMEVISAEVVKVLKEIYE